MSQPSNEQSKDPKLPTVRYAALSTNFLMLGFVLSFLPMPAGGVAVIPLIASLVYGVRHQRVLRDAGAPKPTLRMGWISLALTGFLLAMVVAPLVQYQDSYAYQKCMWGANTRQAATACADNFNQHPGVIQQFFMGQ